MFRPNQKCSVRATDAFDAYGQPVPGLKKKEDCAVVTYRVFNKKTSVRADSSASKGSALELEADLIILLSPKTVAKIDSIVEVLGNRFRISYIEPRLDIAGRIDHYQCGGTYWNEIV